MEKFEAILYVKMVVLLAFFSLFIADGQNKLNLHNFVQLKRK